jgi:AAA+ superfamily predicted ATPase
VLGRSERWGAILLIDEADVYIHERGSDIEQNAIVGVFLRVLEYYRGVLFMTTNRGTLVDDAIISRLTARFRYKNPTADEQEQLWRVLASQNKIDLPESEIKVIVKSMQNLSGRDIKNLLKLAYVASLKKGSGKVSAETIKYVSRFKQSDEEK